MNVTRSSPTSAAPSGPMNTGVGLICASNENGENKNAAVAITAGVGPTNIATSAATAAAATAIQVVFATCTQVRPARGRAFAGSGALERKGAWN